MRAFFTNLLAMCNIQPAAKPAEARECEFCGGGRCFGACGATSESSLSRRDEQMRLDDRPHNPEQDSLSPDRDRLSRR